MKRLFEVIGKFFDNKENAKWERDAARAKGNKEACVSLGPDHRLYGVKGHPTTHHNRMMRSKKK